MTKQSSSTLPTNSRFAAGPHAGPPTISETNVANPDPGPPAEPLQPGKKPEMAEDIRRNMAFLINDYPSMTAHDQHTNRLTPEEFHETMLVLDVNNLLAQAIDLANTGVAVSRADQGARVEETSNLALSGGKSGASAGDIVSALSTPKSSHRY